MSVLDGFSRFILVDSSRDYTTIPANFEPGKIHYVGTDFRTPLILLPLLTLGLDFITVPLNHEETVHTRDYIL
jgi:hypothetical protein